MHRASFATAALALGALSAVHAQTIQVDKNNRTIAITAQDTATAQADIATVSIGFTVYAPDAASAYRNGSRISNAVLDALKQEGVPDKAIESRDQNLARTEFPGEPIPPGQRAQRQFTLVQTWAVHTSATDAAKILHMAIEAGANDSGNIQWDLADRNALQAQAAEKALVRAHTVADRMAAGLNVHLGALIYASNQMPAQHITPMYSMAVRAGPPTHPVAQLAIRPQQVEESATVYAVFSIE